VNSDTYTYKVNVANLGPDTATNIVILDTLPQNLHLISSTLHGYTYNSLTNIITWTLPQLLSGQIDSFSITVNTTQLGIIKNGVGVTGKEVDNILNNNYSSITLNKEGTPFLFPTLFTPNGDGINDNFIIKGLEDYPENDLEIFNRWGNQVFKASGYMSQGKLWDGANLNDGTYFYILKVTMNGVQKQYGGYTTIIRNGK